MSATPEPETPIDSVLRSITRLGEQMEEQRAQQRSNHRETLYEIRALETRISTIERAEKSRADNVLEAVQRSKEAERIAKEAANDAASHRGEVIRHVATIDSAVKALRTETDGQTRELATQTEKLDALLAAEEERKEVAKTTAIIRAEDARRRAAWVKRGSLAIKLSPLVVAIASAIWWAVQQVLAHWRP